jgi:hypothetical protein
MRQPASSAPSTRASVHYTIREFATDTLSIDVSGER